MIDLKNKTNQNLEPLMQNLLRPAQNLLNRSNEQDSK